MAPANRPKHVAWAFLVAATLFTFWVTAALSTQIAAIAACMVLAAAKAFVVLRYFMASDRLSLPLKMFIYAWPLGCAAMILGVAWLPT